MEKSPRETEFIKSVNNRFNIYNSLFLSLLFRKIQNIGNLIPLLNHECRKGLESGKEPLEILDTFFRVHTTLESEEEKIDFMFRVIQYVERQVVLYDSVEDAASDRLLKLGKHLSLTDCTDMACLYQSTSTLVEKMSDFSVRIVFTAHPTQFYPRSVLDIIEKLRSLVRENKIDEIELSLQQLGLTSLMNARKPTPLDEAKNIIYFLRSVYYDAVGDLYAYIKENIPVFESMDSMERAESIMRTLFDIQEYRSHVRFRGDRQTIMLGFSDGTKDGGYLQAKRFLPYLENKSTLKYYGMANIGSRPAKRGKTDKLTLMDLRAISFVGSWSQLRQNVPGYFGVGTALKALADDVGIDELRKLYREVPFFKALILNRMMSMSKCFFGLTGYISKDEEYKDFWNILFEEFELSKQMTLLVSNSRFLMEEEPISSRSIQIRENIVLPLLTIQQYAFQKIDKKSDHLQTYEKIIHRSLYGNINASRNSA